MDQDERAALLLVLIGLVMCAGGLAAIGGAVYRWRRGQRATRTYRSTTGRISNRYLPKGSEIRFSAPHYTIDFITTDNQDARFNTDSIGWKPKNVGDNVNLLYDPDDPGRAVVRDGERVATILLSIAGATFTVLGLLLALGGVEAFLNAV